MTVKELLAELKDMPKDAEVVYFSEPRVNAECMNEHRYRDVAGTAIYWPNHNLVVLEDFGTHQLPKLHDKKKSKQAKSA